MKKYQVIIAKIFIIATFAVLTLVLLEVFFKWMYGFNPDEHTCLDTVRTCEGLIAEQLKIDPLCYDKCTKWRPKTFCELHPDNTNYCVCEDWCEQTFVRELISIDFNISEKGVYKTCTKAHQKTIADLSCTELRDYFEHGRQCTGVPPYSVCKYPTTYIDRNPATRQENILYHMMLKDCTG